MKYTFSIHGVPYGSQSWGDISDSEYLRSFYNSVSASNVPTQMIVDIRYSGNTICTYYHYLMLSNVNDCKSRPGSYFGMTICFEGAYCSDFVKLYNLFSACFKQVVLNSILIHSGERYTYALEDFDTADNIAVLKRVDVAIRKYVPSFEDKLVAFAENFSPHHRNDGVIEKWAIDDVGNKTFVNILLRDSMVSLSPSYPVSYKKVEILQGDNRNKDNRIKTLESNNGNLQSENEDLKTEISNKNKEIESKITAIKQQDLVINEQKGTIASLETERKKLSNTLNETRRQIEVLKDELRQAQNNRDDETLQKCLATLKTIAQKRANTDQLIDDISPRLRRAEENIRHIDDQLNKRKSFKLNTKHLLLGGLVIVAIISIVGIFLPIQRSVWPYDTVTSSDVQEMIDQSLNPINKRLDNIKEKVDNVNIDKYSDIYKPVNHAPQFDGGETSFIDIKDGGDVVEHNRTYKLTAKKGPKKNRKNLSTGGGVFVVKLPDNTEIQLQSTDNGKTADLYVDPEWKSFTIIYRYGDSDVKDRKITATGTRE